MPHTQGYRNMLGTESKNEMYEARYPINPWRKSGGAADSSSQRKPRERKALNRMFIAVIRSVVSYRV